MSKKTKDELVIANRLLLAKVSEQKATLSVLKNGYDFCKGSIDRLEEDLQKAKDEKTAKSERYDAATKAYHNEKERCEAALLDLTVAREDIAALRRDKLRQIGTMGGLKTALRMALTEIRKETCHDSEE